MGTCVCLYFTTMNALEISYLAASDRGRGGGGFYAWLFCRQVVRDRGGLALVYLRSVVSQMDRDLQTKDKLNGNRCIAHECWLENLPSGVEEQDVLAYAKLWDEKAECKFLETEPSTCVVHFSKLETTKFFKNAVNFHYSRLQKPEKNKKPEKGKKVEKVKKPIVALLDEDRCDNTETFYLKNLYLESALNHQVQCKVATALNIKKSALGNGTVLDEFHKVCKGLSRNPKGADTHPYVDVPSAVED